MNCKVPMHVFFLFIYLYIFFGFYSQIVAKIFHKKAKGKYILERNNMLIVNNFPKNIPVLRMKQYIDKREKIESPAADKWEIQSLAANTGVAITLKAWTLKVVGDNSCA